MEEEKKRECRSVFYYYCVVDDLCRPLRWRIDTGLSVLTQGMVIRRAKISIFLTALRIFCKPQ